MECDTVTPLSPSSSVSGESEVRLEERTVTLWESGVRLGDWGCSRSSGS